MFRKIFSKIKIPYRFCCRCCNNVYISDVKGYAYVCYICDENLDKEETNIVFNGRLL